MDLDGKCVVITGGTGSLGGDLVHRLLSGEMGQPRRIIVFSRDEAKQHYMRLKYLQRPVATEDIIYENSQRILAFRIGDVRDYSALLQVVREADVVFHAAALKQVPTCEYFPYEAIQTNVTGTHNLVRAIRENHVPVQTVIGLSTDKACKPVNVMGMTKALQERILVNANQGCGETRFMCVRYGNVVASRGSVVPLFLEQIRLGGPITITLKEMTRFLLSLEQAVDTVFAALRGGLPGDTYVPKIPSALVLDIALALLNGRKIPIVYSGIRPGEKIHEILVSEEECYRTIERGNYFVIRPILPELRGMTTERPALKGEYSSQETTLSLDGVRRLLATYPGDNLPKAAGGGVPAVDTYGSGDHD
jgi:FlaA1/EpsC-like NDP-sugar epimerase